MIRSLSDVTADRRNGCGFGTHSQPRIGDPYCLSRRDAPWIRNLITSLHLGPAARLE